MSDWERELTALLRERGPETRAIDVLAPEIDTSWWIGLVHGLMLAAVLVVAGAALWAW